MDVFIQELKRQLNIKRFSIYILIAGVLALLWTRFIVGGATVDFMQAGFYKGYKGTTAIEMAAKDRNVTAGEMTEEKFQEGLNAFYGALRSNDESDVEVTQDLLKYAVYADKIIMQELNLGKIRGESNFNIKEVPKDAGKHFYENEDICYENYISKNAENEDEKNLALSMWNKVKKPYVYYSGFEQWSEGIEHIMMFSFVLMIVTSIFASSIVAKDKETGIDEIIMSTTKGKKELTIAKIVIPWITAISIYIFGVGLYVIMLKIFLPTNALETSIQVSARSILNYSHGELLEMVFFHGFIGVLCIASFSTWLSTLVKKSSRSMEISILTILAALILCLFLGVDTKGFNLIKMLIPGGIVFSNVGFSAFPVITIFGKTFLLSTVLIVISVSIFVFYILLAAINYRRR